MSIRVRFCVYAVTAALVLGVVAASMASSTVQQRVSTQAGGTGTDGLIWD